MKKLKNKRFYTVSFLIYLFMVLVSYVISVIYLEPNVRSFFLSFFSANKVGSENIIEIVVDDSSISKYPWPWSNEMYTEILDYLHTYAKPKVIGLDIFLPTIDVNNKADMGFVNQVGKMNNLVTSFTPESGSADASDKEFMNEFKDRYSLKINDDALFLNSKFEHSSHSGLRTICPILPQHAQHTPVP